MYANVLILLLAHSYNVYIYIYINTHHITSHYITTVSFGGGPP